MPLPTASRQTASLHALPVFYVHDLVGPPQSFSPSAAKPAQVLESWQRRGFPIEIRRPRALTVDELALAHDRSFVVDVLAGRRANGFGNTDRGVAATLPFTSGAMFAAAVEALHNGAVAVAPVSGFHHAGYGHAGGCCTFNGLVITAQLLRREHGVGRVGLLDFDQHSGDGTADIIETLGLDFIDHHTAGATRWRPADAPRFLEAIPQVLGAMQASGVEFVLYQAGADPHVDDPLGGFLTTAQLAERDRRVFETCRTLHLPVAWDLAGGYQVVRGGIGPVLEIHDNTMRAAGEVWGLM